MVSLTEIQELIFRCVDALSRAMPAARRERLTKGLAALRVAERDYLASHPNILRKASGEGSYEQFQRDLAAAKLGREAPPAPNAPTPAENETVYRAPENLRGLTLHTVAGMLEIPGHGIVSIAARPDGHDDKCECAKCSMHRDLRGRGFREQHARKSASAVALEGIRDVHRLGRARAIAVAAVGKARGVDAGDDVGAWLHDRAAKAGVPSETRRPQYDGPGPAPQYATSAADFRRQYYGDN